MEKSFHTPDEIGISRIGIQFRVFMEIPSSRPDRLHVSHDVTTLAFKMAFSRLLGRCVSSRQACRLASLASLAEVCLSQPVRRQTMCIFPQFACGLRMEVSPLFFFSEEKVFTGQGHAETNLDLPSVIRRGKTPAGHKAT